MNQDYTYGAMVLAGGKGKRMGNVNKAMLKYGKSTFLSMLEQILTDFPYKYLSTNQSEMANNTSFTTVLDEEPGQGPMGGIYSVLKATPCNAIFVLPCDMPFFTKELVDYIISQHRKEAVLYYVEENGREYPLCGIYTKESIPVLEQLLKEKNFKMRQVLERAGGRKLKIPKVLLTEMYFLNINTLEEYKNIEQK